MIELIASTSAHAGVEVVICFFKSCAASIEIVIVVVTAVAKRQVWHLE